MNKINFLVNLTLFLVLLACNGTIDGNGDKNCPSPTDTTSHAFIWQVDTLGESGASVLYDVAIVDENNAWAVGEMYLKDSTGEIDPILYNLARWNGLQWNYERVLVRDFGSATGYYPLKAVYGFASNDVWFASDADLIQWNGSSYTSKAFFMTAIPFDGQVLKMWGTNSSNIYCVGRNGSIYHYSGSSWTKLGSGTTIDIQDIWGGMNCRGETQILALASNGFNVPTAKQLLQIQGTTVSTINSSGLPDLLSSVWFIPSQRYYIGGDGVFQNSKIGDAWLQESFPAFYVFSMRGTAVNDIVAAGGYGFLSHYNGSTWRHYTETGELSQFSGNYYAVAISTKLVVAVGGLGGVRAIAAVGKR